MTAALRPTLADVRQWPATVSVREACRAIGISPAWGYQLVNQGEFPVKTIRVRSRARVVVASLVRLLETGNPE